MNKTSHFNPSKIAIAKVFSKTKFKSKYNTQKNKCVYCISYMYTFIKETKKKNMIRLQIERADIEKAKNIMKSNDINIEQ